MKNIRNHRLFKPTIWTVIFVFLSEFITPSVSWALTSGPASPEFSSFEPVATTNLVNPFTGSFTYNLPVVSIPGPEGGGYSMSLSYHSGTSPEEEASWVGYGWTLNAGAILRNKKGNPDDYKGETVRHWNKVDPNWTVAATGSVGNLEVLSKNIPLGFNGTLRYNNYKGFGTSVGSNLKLMGGVASLGYSVDDGSGSFSFSVNPAALLYTRKYKNNFEYKKAIKEASATDAKEEKKALKDRMKDWAALQNVKDVYNDNWAYAVASVASSYGLYALSDYQRPSSVTPYTGLSINFTADLEVDPGFIPVGGIFGLTGKYSSQANDPKLDLPAYGYLYNSDALSNVNAQMDYSLEKEAPFHKRDNYLSIPHTGADNYSLTGEGLNGGFRLKSNHAGHYRPNEVESKTDIIQQGMEFHAATMVGTGGHVGVGRHNLRLKGEWTENGNMNDYQFENQEDEDLFFLFSDDLGGSAAFGENFSPQTAELEREKSIPGLKDFSFEIPSAVPKTITTKVSGEDRVGRSSYIAYNTHETLEKTFDGKRYRNFTTNSTALDGINHSNLSDGLAEFSVVSAAGMRYNYGLPVYSRLEKDLQFGLIGLNASDVDNNQMAYKAVSEPKNSSTVVGEERDDPYATMHLLTEILTADYIDLTNDGLTPDDFGGYTKFDYRRVFGSDDKKDFADTNWYKWRIPYNGLSYNRNSLSNPRDDMGAVSTGEKEMYYLKTVRTKTHVAVFVTNKSNFIYGGKQFSGSQDGREDGWDANHNESLASASRQAQGHKRPELLERIEVYSLDDKGDLGRLIQTTHFDYDNSQLKGLPNGETTNTGKLTLKKVWFEYNGVKNARISPYKFDYLYPQSTDYAAEVRSRYPLITAYADDWNTNEQNPGYNPFLLDAWGNYQENGSSRYAAMQTWLDQNPDESTFDPAAWQLKKITLPTGGEIHVQYEAHDYRFVQDRSAMAMVSLTNESSDDSDPGNTKFYLNLEDIGIESTNQSAIHALAQKIRDEIVDKKDKIYFKFLYALVGSTANMDKCNTDYVTGYTDIKEVGVETGKLFLRLGNDQSDYSTPRKICIDFVKSERGGMLDPFGGCNASIDGMRESQNPNLSELTLALIAKVNSEFSSNTMNCLDVDYQNSYLRIPLVQPKKGGGVRVKRVLRYDSGIEEGDAQLFGSEFLYEEYDQDLGVFTSSGVATNEPYSMREENALVGFLKKRDDQEWYQRAFSGRDRDQFEGPIGEALLPAPTIGYAKVVTRSIHQGKTSSGFSVNEFHTVREYPFDGRYKKLLDANGKRVKGVEYTEVKDKGDWLVVPAIFANYSVTNLWRTQGYQFIINNRHGKPKITGTYGGNYNDPDKWIPTQTEEHIYYEPGEKIPMLYGQNEIRMERPGYESDVFFEVRRTEDVNKDGNLELDVELSALPIPLPFGSAFPTVSYSESKLHTHVTVKVSKFPTIEKSVRIFSDGAVHQTDYLAYDPQNGRPIRSRSYDGYNEMDLANSANHKGWYTSYNFPANLAYEQFSQKALKEGKFIRSNSDVDIDLVNITGTYNLNFTAAPGKSICESVQGLTAGDEIMVYDGNTAIGIFHVGELMENALYLYKNPNYDITTHSANSIDIEILTSARNNRLNSAIGTVLAYGEKGEPYLDPVAKAGLDKRESWVNRLNQVFTAKNGQGLFANRMIQADNDSVFMIDPATSECVRSYHNVYFDFDLNNDFGKVYLLDFGQVDLNESFVQNGTFYTIRKDNDVREHPFVKSLVSNPDPVAHWQEYSGSPQWGFSDDIQSGYAKMWAALVNGFGPVTEGVRQEVNLQTGKQYIVDYYYRAPNTSKPVDSLTIYLTSADIKGTDPPHIIDPQYYTKSQRISKLVTPSNGNWTLVSDTFICQDAAFDTLAIYPSYTQIPDENHWIHVGKISIRELGSITQKYECMSQVPISGGLGHFELNRETGEMEYFTGDNDCYSHSISCIDFCPDLNDKWKMDGVINATAIELKDQWDYTQNQDLEIWGHQANLVGDPYHTANRSQWRQLCNYTYKDSLIGGASDGNGERTYAQAGTMDGFTFFNWNYPTTNDPKYWIKSSTVTQYSPYGKANEEVNALGVYGSVRYGYHHHLPYAFASNAQYDEMFFESFENVYPGQNNKFYLEDRLQIDTALLDSSFAHSGQVSMMVPLMSIGTTIGTIQFTQHVKDAGMVVKLWASSPNGWLSCTDLQLNIAGAVFKDFDRVARTGEWSLYECRLSSSDLSIIFTDFTGDLSIITHSTCPLIPAEATIHIDDIKAQPADATMSCSVYDPSTYRVLTQFDDHHFGVYYQYSGKGLLVRKRVETEQGLRTVIESQKNVQSESRN